MSLTEARALVGQELAIEYTDRLGAIRTAKGRLLDVEYVPMYGSTLFFDFGEVSLERVAVARRVQDAA